MLKVSSVSLLPKDPDYLNTFGQINIFSTIDFILAVQCVNYK